MRGIEPVTNLADFRRESAEQLSNLITDLENHNREHGSGAQMGKTLGRMLGAVIDREEPDLQKVGADVFLETAQGARTGLAELNTKHEQVLNRLGLHLSHEANASLKSGFPSGPISMRIKNVQSFLRYAQSLKPVPTGEGTTPQSFNVLLNQVEKQVAGIDFQHISPIEKDVLENLDALTAVFGRIGGDLNVQRLENYARFQKVGKLPQYLVVEREGLWHEPGDGFGPANWITDITPHLLEEKWGKAHGVLRVQEKLGSTGVAEELRQHLLRCIEKANERLPTTTWSEEIKDAFREIMEKYATEIRSSKN